MQLPTNQKKNIKSLHSKLSRRMRSRSDIIQNARVRIHRRLLPDRNCRAIRISLLGILLAFTVITGFVERMIPLDGMMPGMRLGLANLAIVISLYTFHARDTLLLIVLKCLTTALFSGSIIALVYSLTGSLASLLVMLLLIRMKNVSIIGVSVAGAAFHNLGQILVARLIFGTWGILLYLPLLLIVGTVSGLVIGFLAKMMRPRINAYLKANHTR